MIHSCQWAVFAQVLFAISLSIRFSLLRVSVPFTVLVAKLLYANFCGAGNCSWAGVNSLSMLFPCDYWRGLSLHLWFLTQGQTALFAGGFFTTRFLHKGEATLLTNFLYEARTFLVAGLHLQKLFAKPRYAPARWSSDSRPSLVCSIVRLHSRVCLSINLTVID